MKKEDKEMLKSRLAKKIRRTREKIVSMEEMTQPITPENSIGRISRMDAINNKSVMEAALRTARQELENMEYAEKHIDDTDFGMCQKCGNEINFRRLLLIPGSNRCVHCAS
jgi:DnaK suppressor protein